MSNKFRAGQHKVVCDRTGFTVYSCDVQKEWDGGLVRRQSFESRQPQDFVRGVVDYQAVTDARPPVIVFLADNQVTPNSL
jgi:hypothetical protein